MADIFKKSDDILGFALAIAGIFGLVQLLKQSKKTENSDLVSFI